MVKTYVLDTNILLSDPDALFKFDDNNLVLPITAIEEVDRRKKDQNEVGRNARQVGRNLKNLKKLGRLDAGVNLKTGGTLKVAVALSQILIRLPLDLDENTADNRILAVALQYKAILVTNDTNLAIKAEALGVPSEEYENRKVNVDALYSGTGNEYISEESLTRLYETGVLDVVDDGNFYPNQYCVLHSTDNPKHSALARWDSVMKRLELLPMDLKTCGLLPRNSEQCFALDLLLNPEISLVSLIGGAGTGKTLCALAAGLHGVLETKMYKKMLLLKPVVSMDNKHQLGFLPGSMEEKMAPWVASYMDNIEFLMSEGKKSEMPKLPKGKGIKGQSTKFSVTSDINEKEKAKVDWAQEFKDHNILEIGSLEHIRGRSLPNQFIIIDECQNMSLNSIKTVITRAGEGTKVILLGDIEQIDSPYLDASNNGLTYVADKFKEQNIAGHITLTKSERSPLAELAAKLL
jgi:PhoH-like ATPase